MMAVSYTHLDVYKRQVSLRLAEARGTNLDPTTVADFVGSITTL